MGSGPGWPVKHMGRLMGRAGRPIYNAHLMGRGPARPINFSEDGRPGPLNLREWAAARPTSSHYQFFTARPGPARLTQTAHDKP